MSGHTNIVILEGRPTREPIFMKTVKGISICKFSLANNSYYYKDNNFVNDVYFFEFVCFGKIAEKAALKLHKGLHVLISGQLRQDVYTSKSGDKKQKVYVLVTDIKYLNSKTDTSSKRVLSDNHFVVNGKVSKRVEDVVDVSF